MRVAIVGGLADQQHFLASDYDEIWGMNAVRFDWLPKWDRRFNLHPFAYLEKNWAAGLESERLEADKNTPLYVIDSWPSYYAPRQVLFPRQDVSRGFIRPDYHCCVVDWMIAFAIRERVSILGLHGISLTALHSNQPISARPCVEYWCGVAEGHHVTVNVKQDCDLFSYFHLVKTNTVYGYEETCLIEDRSAGTLRYKI